VGIDDGRRGGAGLGGARGRHAGDVVVDDQHLAGVQDAGRGEDGATQEQAAGARRDDLGRRRGRGALAAAALVGEDLQAARRAGEGAAFEAQADARGCAEVGAVAGLPGLHHPVAADGGLVVGVSVHIDDVAIFNVIDHIDHIDDVVVDVVDVVGRDVAADALHARPRVVTGAVGKAVIAELPLVLRGGVMIAGRGERETGERGQEE